MRKNRNDRLLRRINAKCDRILGLLNVMRSEEKDTMLDSIRDSARDMYLSSLEERRRSCGRFSIMRHD